MHLKDLLFLPPKISFFPNLHPEMVPEYVFERGFTNSASFFTEKRGASFSQFPLEHYFASFCKVLQTNFSLVMDGGTDIRTC